MGDYYFDSTGGCELCDAMEGWYEEEPARPHPYCDCTIGEPPADDQDAVEFDWSYDVGDTERDHDHPDDGYFNEVTVTVECYSGRTLIDSTDVAFESSEGPADEAIFDYIDDKIYEAAAHLAEELGHDCPPAPDAHGRDVDDDFAFA